MEGQDNEKRGPREEIFSQVLRAGKRTYFFDVKVTSTDDYYLTITESKKRFNNRQGRFFYEKHKIFLYKEDFDNFLESFSKTIEFIKAERPVTERRPLYKPENKEVSEDNSVSSETQDSEKENFSNVEFDDLGTDNENNDNKKEPEE